ncbi:hypothetical protein L3X38_041309 [Prunus dulcis]|uniref:Uncharacterized protein n=1 Tax=Prunus dulcis TaxID=3755 RepID=A0AAD4UUI6_PRUDU|nr:hypothetical protein L3X38_041309 [Prunus dulcis]
MDLSQAIVISQIFANFTSAEDDPMIYFQRKDLIGLDLPHNNTLITSIQISQAVIQHMGLETNINKSTRSLTCSNGATTVTMGMIDLNVYSPPVISSQTFMVIDKVSSYNGILGRP